MADPARNEHLFVVRIWTEPAAQGLGSQRGCIEHVTSKERRYFSQLAEALDFLAALAAADDQRIRKFRTGREALVDFDRPGEDTLHPVAEAPAQSESVACDHTADADHPR